MSRICYLCDRKASKNIALHAFPNNPLFRQKWKDVCGLTETDNVKRVYICSVHFTPECVKIAKVAGNPRIILKFGSVPSISVPVPFKAVLRNDNVVKKNAMKSGNDSCLSSASVRQDVNHIDADVEPASIVNCVPFSQVNLETDQANRNCSDENYASTPKKCRFHEQRFISEIVSSDFATLTRVGRTLKFMKDEDGEKVKKLNACKKSSEIRRNVSSL